MTDLSDSEEIKQNALTKFGAREPHLKLVSRTYQAESIGLEARYPLSIVNTTTKLGELAGLEDNWDGHGAKAPSAAACVGALDLAYGLFVDSTPIPDLFPVPNGNIQFEWSCFGLDLEIEVESNRKCFACFEDIESGENWEREFTFDFTQLKKALDELASRNRAAGSGLVVNG